MTIGLCRRSKTIAAIMIFELDKGKPVLDVPGVSIGDLLLQQIAIRTLDILKRSSDTLARINGDQFVVLVSQIGAPTDALKVAEKILKGLQEPFEIEGHVINSTCSIGIAVFPDHGEHEMTLMKNAEHAMNVSKDKGGNIATVFSGPVVEV